MGVWISLRFTFLTCAEISAARPTLFAVFPSTSSSKAEAPRDRSSSAPRERAKGGKSRQILEQERRTFLVAHCGAQVQGAPA